MPSATIAPPTKAFVDELKQRVCARVDEVALELTEVSDWIGQHPELGLQEQEASRLLASTLERHGLVVERDVGNLSTAFHARVAGGHDGHRVAILAEYDALPGLGHGCGHNIIGTAAIGAGIALASVADVLRGEVVVIGTPAEESAVDNSGGKAHLLAAGVFAGVDAAMMIHPSTQNLVIGEGSLAARGVDFSFHGRAAHAAASPERGVNALDAVIQTFNAIAALRQHVRPDVRIHGIITHGGLSANIVPAFASCRFRVRALDKACLSEVLERVVACAEGAARATGARLEWREYMPAYDNYVPSAVLGDVLRSNLQLLGIEVAAERRNRGRGSTDFGNVSQRLPAAYAALAIADAGVAGHSVEFREAALSDRGRQAVLTGAKMLAMAALDLLANPALIAAAKEEHARAVAALPQT